MKGKLKHFIYKIDSSDSTTYLLAFFQVVAVITFRIYQVTKSVTLKPYLFYVFMVLQITVAIVLILRSIFAGRYSTIKLIYNKATGVIVDRKVHARNISLRAESLKNILLAIPKEKLFEVGRKTGGDFYNCFWQHLQETGKKDVSIENKIGKWFEYDSSSGMGRFQLTTFEPHPFRLCATITNPFTGTCEDGSCFLQGYVLGFCELLYHNSLTIECHWLADPAACRLTVSQSN